MIKRYLIGFFLFLGYFSNAQIGIDLTEMIPAPDSGYIIMTTGDEYPDRGLQKYIAFDSLIPLDTFYQKTDSVCFRFAYDTADVCYPFSSGGGSQTLSVLRDGDTIKITISDGNQIAFKDSTRSNADIAQVARDSVAAQTLSFNTGAKRTTLSDGGGAFTILGVNGISTELTGGGAYTIDGEDLQNIWSTNGVNRVSKYDLGTNWTFGFNTTTPNAIIDAVSTDTGTPLFWGTGDYDNQDLIYRVYNGSSRWDLKSYISGGRKGIGFLMYDDLGSQKIYFDGISGVGVFSGWLRTASWFRVDSYISLNGDIGTSSKVLFGGGTPTWGNLPTWSMVQGGSLGIDFKKDGATQSFIGFRGVGGLEIRDSSNYFVFDGSGITGGGATNIGASKVGTTVTLTSSTGTGDSFSVADNDNDDTNELQDVSASVTGTTATLSITGGSGDSFSIADNDNSSTNELQSLSFTTGAKRTTLSNSGGSFTILGTDGISTELTAGGAYTISGASVTGDTYTMTRNGENIDFKKNAVLNSTIGFLGSGGISVTGSGANITIDGSGISGGATNIGASKTGTTVTLTSSTGTGDSFSVADNDNSATNELQDVSFSKVGNTVTATISGGIGDSFSVEDNDNSATNEIQKFTSRSQLNVNDAITHLSGTSSYGGLRFNGEGGISVTVSTDASDNSVFDIDASGVTGDAYALTQGASLGLDFKKNGSTNSFIGLRAVGGLALRDSSNYFVFDGSGISGGATNIGASKVGTTVTLTSSTGTGDSFSVADNDNSTTNELQSLSFTTGAKRTTLSDGGGSFTVLGTGGISTELTAGGAYTIDGSGIAGGGIWEQNLGLERVYKYEVGDNLKFGFNKNSPGSILDIVNTESNVPLMTADGDYDHQQIIYRVYNDNSRWDLTSQVSGSDKGISFGLYNNSGASKIYLDGRTGQAIFTGTTQIQAQLRLTSSIWLNGDIGTSSKVLFGGGTPTWGSLPTWSMLKNSTNIDFKKDGVTQSTIGFTGSGGISVSSSGANINFDGSGIDESKWTTSGSGIYRNGGVTIGGITTAANEFRVYDESYFSQEVDFDDHVNILNGSHLVFGSSGSKIFDWGSGFKINGGTGKDVTINSEELLHLTGDDLIIRSSTDLVVEAADDLELKGDNTVFQAGTSFSGNTVVAASSSFTLPSASGYPNGTIKHILNTSGSNINITIDGGLWVLGTKRSISVIAYGSSWYVEQ